MRSPDVVRETGVSYRQLDYWTRCGLIREAARIVGVQGRFTADGRPASEVGSGSRRSYSATEVSVIKALLRLCKLGMEPRSAAPIARRAVEELIPLEQALADACRAVGQ